MKPSLIQRDNFDLKKLISVTGAKMDPLLVDFWDDKLYFISAGNVMPENIADSQYENTPIQIFSKFHHQKLKVFR